MDHPIRVRQPPEDALIHALLRVERLLVDLLSGHVQHDKAMYETGTVGEHPNRLKTHCPKGHPYDGENLYLDPKGYRRCRACKLKARQEKRWRETGGRSSYRALVGPKRPNQNVGKTHCPKGHPYDGENLYIDPKGNRRCRACKKARRSNSDQVA